MATADIQIKRRDVTDLSGGVVALHSASLRNELLHHQAPTLTALSTDVARVSIDEISIDDHGRVLVANPSFSQAVLNRIARQPSPQGALDVAVNLVCITIKF